MKFSTALFIAFPLLASSVAALTVPEGSLEARAGFGNGNFKGGQGQKGTGKTTTSTTKAVTGAGTGAKGTTTAAAAATTSTTAAAAAAVTSTAAVAAAAGGSTDTKNAQTSLTLLNSVIATGFAQDGQGTPTAGQVASLTSTNNFINFCATNPSVPITNGQQIKTGSCNPAPMGFLPSVNNMPTAKFAFPQNMGNVAANTAFTVLVNVANYETGHFTNAQASYFAAPQQLNGQGQIIGHSHIVIEKLTSLTSTTPADAQTFAFFKGIDGAAVNGQLSVPVTAGLAAGVYKVSTINTAANHQPVAVPIAQHASLDDVVYFTVGGAGAGTGSGATGGGTGATTTAATAKAATTTAKAVTTAKAATTTAKAATTTTKAATGAGGNKGGKAGTGKGKFGRRFLREY